MKKIILLILSLSTLFIAASCQSLKKENPLTLNVSTLRLDAFFGENENYALWIYPETREAPLIFDGKIGDQEKVVIVKLKLKGEARGSYLVNFATDKQYVADFSFNNLTDCYTATVTVEKLPDKPIIATITHNDDNQNISLSSLKNKDTISADDALEKAYAYKKEYVDSLSVKNAFNGEIVIKLICEGNRNFWYVGFITEEKTLAVLIDGKTGKPLAEKTLLN